METGMRSCSRHHRHHSKSAFLFIIIGISSIIWLILRSGRKPSRIQYPCQKAALTESIAFLAWISSVLTGHFLYKRIKIVPKKLLIVPLMILLLITGFKTYQIYNKGRLPKEIWGQGVKSRVVWVTNSSATNGWSGDSSRVNASTVQGMLDGAVIALTSTSSVAEAWTKIFRNHNGGNDYVSGEKIAIKVNFNNSWGSGTENNCYQDHCPTYQVVNALLHQLIDNKNIPQSDIGVYDTSRDFPDYFINGIRAYFPNVKLNPDLDSWPPCTTGSGVRGTGFGCWLDSAKYLINMPLLRTHSQPGVSLSLKNHLGSTSEPRNFHGNMSQSDPNSNSLVQLNSHPTIKNKTIMVVDDALYGLRCGGPGGNPDGSCGIKPYPNSLFLSEDPIAVDSVMIDYLESVGASFNTDPRIAYIAAASVGLGNYGNSCRGGSCNFMYNNIEFIRCTPDCSNTSPAPSPTPSFIISDLKLLMSRYLTNNDSSYYPIDAKVNMLDAAYVITNWNP